MIKNEHNGRCVVTGGGGLPVRPVPDGRWFYRVQKFYGMGDERIDRGHDVARLADAHIYITRRPLSPCHTALLNIAVAKEMILDMPESSISLFRMGRLNDRGIYFSFHTASRSRLRVRLAICLALTWQVLQTQASVFYVTDSSDDTNGFTLRAAIIRANWAGGTNTIILTNNYYALTISGADEDAAFSGDLDVVKGNLTIVGASATKVAIDASALGDRAFQVLADAELTLSNLAVTGGSAPSGISGSSGGNGENGGGIFNAGTLILYGSVVSGNAGGSGGDASSIWGSGGNGGSGGGIYNVGTLILHDSIVSNNCSGLGGKGAALEGNGGSNAQGGNGGDGGGVYNGGTLIFDTCTVSGNTNGAGGLLYGNGGSGGGLYNDGLLSMTNTTVMNNSSGSAGDTSGSGGSGGGIYNISITTLTSCLVSSNSSGAGGRANDSFSWGGGGGGSGGGIFNGGTLNLYSCICRDNSSGAGAAGGSVLLESGSVGGPSGVGGAGGGICNTNWAALNCCTVSGNGSGTGGTGGNGQGGGAGGTGGNGGNGGGIYNSGNITLTLCTVSGNTDGTGGTAGAGSDAANGGAGGKGGGIFSCGMMALIACTVSDNSGGAGGIGGYNWGFNSAPGGTGGNGGSGGGIFDDTNSQPATLSDTLIALNRIGSGGLGGGSSGGIIQPPPPPAKSVSGSAGSGFDIAGDFASRGYNLIGQADGSTGITNGVDSNLAGSTNAPINPRLGPLQMNGGSNFTHALLFGSPAIDQGRSFGVTTDQRGHARPHDYSAISNAPGGDGSDIGAFEADTPLLNLRQLNTSALISWDTNCPGYSLESCTNFSSPNNWKPVLITPSVAGSQYQVTNNVAAGRKFFRLRSN